MYLVIKWLIYKVAWPLVHIISILFENPPEKYPSFLCVYKCIFDLIGIFISKIYLVVHPTSMLRAAPLTCPPASEDRKTANAPRFSGLTNSAVGCLSRRNKFLAASFEIPRSSANLSTCLSTRGVSAKPGQIVLLVTPVPAHSSAIARDIPVDKIWTLAEEGYVFTKTRFNMYIHI